MKINEEYIIDLIHKYRKGILSDTEKDELLSYYNLNKSLVKSYFRLYTDVNSIAFADKINKDQAWDNIHKRISTKRNNISRLYMWSISAAAIIILISISVVLKLNTHNENTNFAAIAPVGSSKAILTLSDGSIVNLATNKGNWSTQEANVLISKDSSNNVTYEVLDKQISKVAYNTISVPRGGEFDLKLSDGTIVKLNSESELKYPVNFVGNLREVYLKGEAFFNVAHNKEIPFIVNISDTKVNVIGTKFNVSGYSTDDIIATTLVEGSVEIEALGNKELLNPGYQSQINKHKKDITIKKVNTNLYTSWVIGIYEFENARLEQIMAQLGRWYNVEFYFNTNNLKDIRFTGAVKRNKSINYALELLEHIAKVQFQIKDNYIVIKSENKK